ncbi:MAG: LuxR C-terminal-related transcriptional regulator [Treponema sp.]|nr:LuxR C-terminal-related transcriptional regulator [Treponema sp.]
MSDNLKQADYICNNEVIKSDFHFDRSRLNRIFTEAMKYPLIMVCAGSGYGKTTAVNDFVREYQTTTVWVQLSERDNVGARFWENFTHSMNLINAEFGASIKKLGFPDTIEKLKQFQKFLQIHDDKKRRIIVFDDCHFIENPAVIRFVEEAIRNLPVGITLFLISRSTPKINIAGHISSDQIFEASEDELRFTESELAQYFRSQGIALLPDSLRSIWQDTEGWAFAVNYIVRSYKKAPGYKGYLRNAMKTNIFRFMEIEVWDNTSPFLRNFLVQLSLIDHLSVDLISLLAGEEKELIYELEKQNAYVRLDSYINAFLIHPLFLEFLKTKQDILPQKKKYETYTVAGQWCNNNGFKIDALSYYEKIENYNAIVLMFLGSPSQIPYDIACYAAAVFERTPKKTFDTVTFLAATHLRAVMCQGLMEEADKLAANYESKFIYLPKDDFFRRNTLSSIYYYWAIIRVSISIKTDVYDFDLYFEKLKNCFDEPIDIRNLITRDPGPWFCAVGSSRKGAAQEYIDVLTRSGEHVSKCYINFGAKEDEFARGELKLYQGDIQGAEISFDCGINHAKLLKHSAVINKTLYYLLRIAVFKGDYIKSQELLKTMKIYLNDPEYNNRFIEYDIYLSWYYCILGMAENIPDWLKENISLYAHVSFIENYANQMKARYCYAIRNYPPLLSYIHDMKQRESYLFGRIEMIVRESCIYYKLKEKEKAYMAFEEAYNNASPNNIIMPFIEMGKDMRTLTSFILKYPENKIPVSWLEDINLKSASYAKRITHIITKYKQANRLTDDIIISTRESEVLTDLSHGLSRSEIAVSRNLSINTVKMLINNVYIKLGAENLADAIRIASERKIL